ncbi:MAG: replication initiator protein [Microviridae sp.]|nr:MAG: replication initiator protein [Microviridae sp.]
MCLYPTLIKNRKYTANKKNGGNVPPIPDERVKYVAVGCQQCIECRKQKARGWQVRLLEDIKTNTNGKFITLTFSNESIKHLTEIVANKTDIDKETGEVTETILEGYELDNEIATKAIRLFLERWRKKYKVSLRHWLVTEIGHNGTENVHLHGIVWTDKDLEEVTKIWSYGYVWTGKKENGKIINYVSSRTVNYIVKYIHKVDEHHKTFKSKVLTSSGIGGNYINRVDSKNNKYKGENTITTYKTTTGHKIAMPVYWRNKIYSEQEREKLWLQLLDKQERWVCGEKIKINDSLEEYYKTLEFHREKNIRLGYGTGEKDWSREQYERQRRQLMNSKRIQSAAAGRPSGRGNSKDIGTNTNTYETRRPTTRTKIHNSKT